VRVWSAQSGRAEWNSAAAAAAARRRGGRAPRSARSSIIHRRLTFDIWRRRLTVGSAR